jgi:hypothetical protein
MVFPLKQVKNRAIFLQRTTQLWFFLDPFFADAYQVDTWSLPLGQSATIGNSRAKGFRQFYMKDALASWTRMCSCYYRSDLIYRIMVHLTKAVSIRLHSCCMEAAQLSHISSQSMFVLRL